jgi:hypothetical protein
LFTGHDAERSAYTAAVDPPCIKGVRYRNAGGVGCRVNEQGVVIAEELVVTDARGVRGTGAGVDGGKARRVSADGHVIGVEIGVHLERVRLGDGGGRVRFDERVESFGIGGRREFLEERDSPARKGLHGGGGLGHKNGEKSAIIGVDESGRIGSAGADRDGRGKQERGGKGEQEGGCDESAHGW